MVKGLDIFREYFAECKDNYVLIGGVACDVLLDEAGLNFRATKDLDIVLSIEALDKDFVDNFWGFVEAGGYEHRQKSTGEKQYYRFSDPADDNFPTMLELFSRTPDGVTLEGEGHLTPIPVEQDADSLSAILLDDEYYACIQQGKREIEGLMLLGAEFILPFKARAWLDLTERRNNGDKIDGRDIRKHRGDVFRLYPLLALDQRVDMTDAMKRDLFRFIDCMREQEGVNLKDFGVRNQSLDEVLGNLALIYDLEDQC